MYDLGLVKEILGRVLDSAETIAARCASVSSHEDFLGSEEGREKLDSICMQLIVIGESVKYLDKMTNGSLLVRYPRIEWSRIMGMRDVLTHRYFDIIEASEQRDDIQHLRKGKKVKGKPIPLDEFEAQLRAEGKLR